MKRKKMWFYIIFINILMILPGVIFFTSKKDYSAGRVEQSRRIGACYADMTNSYFAVLNNEISSVVEEQGDVLITRDSLRSQDKQNEQISYMIKEGVDALIIVPVDWKKITTALEEARAAGIIIIIVDSPVYHEELVDCTVTSDNYDVGIQMANFLKSQKKEARIVLLEQYGTKSTLDRVNGFKQGLSGNNAYRIVVEKIGGGAVEEAMESMEDVIVDKERFDCVFAVNDPCAIGAIAACEKMGMGRGISFLSTDGSPVGKSMIKQGTMMASAAQFPTEMGNAAVESMYQILRGEKCEKKILVPVKLITQYTINSYDVDKWQ